MNQTFRNGVLIVFSTLAVKASAQKTEFGFMAGPQYSTAAYSLRGNEQKTTGKTGFHIGTLANIPFEGNFYFTPSLSYSLKGFGVTLTDTSGNPRTDAVGNSVRLHTIELAPLFTVYLGSSGSRPFIQFGAAGDFTVYGTEDIRLRDGNTVGRTMNFSNDAYGRIAASVILRAGYETASGLFFNAHYNYGLASRNQRDFGPHIRDRVAGVSIGKIFRRKS